MDAVRAYLESLSQSRGVGTAETSGYAALKALVDSVGAQVQPKITYVIHPAQQRGSLPDGGLYEKRKTLSPQPDRGAVEVKPATEAVAQTAQSEQALRYLRQFGLLLITNYWHFALYQLRDGAPELLDEFRLADDADHFWELASRPAKAARERGPALAEFLRRVCMASAPLDRPKIVAEFLASHARDALTTIEAAPDDAALTQVRKPLEDALGITFNEEEGRHFFHSTLVQTLFYGLFSAWVLWHEGKPRLGDSFRLNDIYQYFRLPMLSGLLGNLTGSAMDQLGLRKHLERGVRVLDRVDRPAFFASFETEGAVQYFYEPFLEAFDPDLRKQLGVWYTPIEIVRYMVGRVDQVLRTELNLPDGLADERVVVLDPCCGTGAYLVETLRLIQTRLTETHGEALAPGLLRKAATERIFGFELLPAPYVVSHLQLGLLLARGHAPLKGEQRAGVFLTNALTGWDPAEDGKRQLNLYIFQPDYEKARAVKRDQPILVILGNPPYNGYAGVTQSEEERRLSEDYRTVRSGPTPQGQGLNDLYVRFFRMAERRITEGQPGHGIVSFISNYSWLDSLSCPGMGSATSKPSIGSGWTI